MAATHKYTVTHAGQTFTRRTARTYTHVIVARSDPDGWLARSLVAAKDASKYHAHYGKTREAYLEELTVQVYARFAALKEAGEFDTVGVLTWCGRPDLALKEQTRALASGWYAEAHAVPVPSIG